MDADSDEPEDFKIVKQHVEQLAEFFDSVQVFVTSNEGSEGTKNINYGSGNWYARYGQVATWLKKSDERTCVEVRAENDAN